jgi:O-antigen ligase
MENYSRIVSLRNITTVREAHSLYPGTLAETGALGFITLMSIFGYTLYKLAKSRNYWLERNNNGMASLSTGFFLSIIAYLTTGLFLHMSYIRYIWLILAMGYVASQFRQSDAADGANIQNQENPSYS